MFWNSTVVTLLLENTTVRNTTSGYHPLIRRAENHLATILSGRWLGHTFPTVHNSARIIQRSGLSETAFRTWDQGLLLISTTPAFYWSKSKNWTSLSGMKTQSPLWRRLLCNRKHFKVLGCWDSMPKTWIAHESIQIKMEWSTRKLK